MSRFELGSVPEGLGSLATSEETGSQILFMLLENEKGSTMNDISNPIKNIRPETLLLLCVTVIMCCWYEVKYWSLHKKFCTNIWSKLLLTNWNKLLYGTLSTQLTDSKLTILTVANLFFLRTYFLNTISTNLVVGSNFRIDTLDKLVDKECPNVSLIITDNLKYLEHWIDVADDITAKLLRHKINKIGRENVYKDHKVLESFMSKNIVAKKSIITITDKHTASNMHYNLCKSDTRLVLESIMGSVLNLGLSKMTFFNSIYTFLYNISHDQPEKSLKLERL